MFLTASEAEAQGVEVTTFSPLGGIGLGRLVDTRLFVSAGNGFYYLDTENSYACDDGRGYVDAILSLGNPAQSRRMSEHARK